MASTAPDLSAARAGPCPAASASAGPARSCFAESCAVNVARVSGAAWAVAVRDAASVPATTTAPVATVAAAIRVFRRLILRIELPPLVSPSAPARRGPVRTSKRTAPVRNWFSGAGGFTGGPGIPRPGTPGKRDDRLGREPGRSSRGPLGLPLLRDSEHAVGVAGGVDVEPDQVAGVVHAVDRGGARRRAGRRRVWKPPPAVQVNPCMAGRCRCRPCTCRPPRRGRSRRAPSWTTRRGRPGR